LAGYRPDGRQPFQRYIGWLRKTGECSLSEVARDSVIAYTVHNAICSQHQSAIAGGDSQSWLETPAFRYATILAALRRSYHV